MCILILSLCNLWIWAVLPTFHRCLHLQDLSPTFKTEAVCTSEMLAIQPTSTKCKDSRYESTSTMNHCKSRNHNFHAVVQLEHSFPIGVKDLYKKSKMSWVLIPHSLVEVHRCLRGTHHCHPQGYRASKAKKPA